MPVRRVRGAVVLGHGGRPMAAKMQEAEQWLVLVAVVAIAFVHGHVVAARQALVAQAGGRVLGGRRASQCSGGREPEQAGREEGSSQHEGKE